MTSTRTAAAAARDERLREQALRRLEETEYFAADELRGLVHAGSPGGQRAILRKALEPLIASGVICARMERRSANIRADGVRYAGRPVYTGHKVRVYARGPRWAERGGES